MREKIGRIMLALAAAVLLASVRLPSPPQRDVYKARGLPADASPIVLQRGVVLVNTADAALLDTLPGIGEVLAQAILEERAANGPFFYPEDLLSVRGIGPARLEKIRRMLDLSQPLEP